MGFEGGFFIEIGLLGGICLNVIFLHPVYDFCLVFV